MRDQVSLNFNVFNGLWSRGDDDTCPADHFIACENLRFDKIGIETREGTTISTTRASRIRRMAIYKPLTGAPRIIMLQENGATFDLFDLTFSLTTALLTGITSSDFSMANAYGRAFLSFHDRSIASATGNLYLYDGSGPTGFRQAGGVPPTNPLVITGTGAGNIELGVLLLMYAHETASGFITKPYVAGIVSQTFAANGNSITITVPVGPAGTVARRIVAAKTIPAGLYNGDYRSQIFYFVPGNGRIPDNTTTSVTLSFFNSELIDSSDYLFDQVSTLPSGLFVNNYGTNLIVGGGVGSESIVWVSQAASPESFSATGGFIIVDPSEQGGVKNGFEHQGAFILLKSKRTYITSNNGDVPASWPVDILDASVGSECHGVSVISDSPASWKGVALVADRAGLMLFNGAYIDVPMTDKVRNWWTMLDKSIFDQIQVIVDPQLKRVYCLVPKGDDNTLPFPNTILVASYENGLNSSAIKWCPWAFYPEVWGSKASINCAIIDLDATTQRTTLKLGVNSDLVVLAPTARNDFDSRFSIPSFARFSYITYDRDDTDVINTFLAIRSRVKGLGRIYITPNDLDDMIIKTYQEYLDIQPRPAGAYEKIINFVAQKMSIVIHQNTQYTQPFNNNYWQMSKLTVFGKPTWASLPSLTNIKS